MNSDTSCRVLLARRRFSLEDQKAFAQLSGDLNPIHIDQVASRRSVVGAVVVHGIHTVSWSLDVLAKSRFNPAGLRTIDVRFPRPLYLGDEATLTLQSKTEDEIRLTAEVGDKTVASIRLGCRPEPRLECHNPHNLLPDSSPLVPFGEPEDLDVGTLLGKVGNVDFAASARDFTAAFPDAAILVGASRLRGLAACSRLVGMNCPGLRSVFSRLTLEWTDEGVSSRLAYEVVGTDPRFNTIRMRVFGVGLTGQIEAFSPPKSPEQVTVNDLAKVIGSHEFEEQTVLVIGGSRGLGELTAKAVAAGGGRVLITYAVGHDDAARVAEEIRVFGGKADVFPYDVTQPASGQLTELKGVMPTQVYYFATCQIFRAKTEAFEPNLLERFLAFYASGFYNLCRELWDSGVTNVAVFYPSSVAVEDRPRGLTEYAMAKAAGETLCVDIPRILPGVRVYQQRLPRLLTDQTAAMMPQSLPQAIDIILPIIRSMKGDGT